MTTQPTAFVTGATGFVGAAVARLLLNQGYSLRVLARKNSDRRNLDGLKVDVIEGDLGKIDGFKVALKGCTSLFHVAADYRIWVPDPVAMNKINVDGTRDLMLAAQDAGIGRIVYTSSVATLGLRLDGYPSDETTPSDLSDMVGIYKKSKYLAEQEVHRLIRHHQLPAIIVNPSTPIGPRDIKPTPTGRIIIDAVLGKMPAYVDTGLNIVHVDDVAMGHWLAHEKGKIGERYILGGENLGLGQILGIIAELSGKPAPTVQLPRWPLYPIAWGMEIVARLTGIDPMMSRDALRMSKKKMYFTSCKAERELGYTARPARTAIEDAIVWFRLNGMC